MEFTGERFVPDVGGAIALEHWHRYLLARELAKDKVVLDIACGEGYGSSLLAATATRVIGVDISEEAVSHASSAYTQPNLEFRQGDCANIPMPDQSVDMVVSFETLEHHTQHLEMMAEVKRVLKKDGVLIISTPDKRVYSDIPEYHNIYHVKELYLDEFENLLKTHFQNIRIYSQRVVYGSAIYAQGNTAGSLTFDAISVEQPGYSGLPNAPYLIAFASNETLPVAPDSLMDFPTEKMLASPELNPWKAKLDEHLKMHAQALKQKQDQITALHQSFSWRVTAPLRAIKRLFSSN